MLRNPIIWLIGGIFAMVLSVNVGMVFISSGTAPKLVTPDYYAQGVTYQSVLDARARAAALGWQASLDETRSSAERVVLRLTGLGDAPLMAVRGQAAFYRVDDPALDHAMPLVPLAGEPGMYVLHVARPTRGQWRILLALAAPDATANEPYSLSLPPLRYVSP